MAAIFEDRGVRRYRCRQPVPACGRLLSPVFAVGLSMSGHEQESGPLLFVSEFRFGGDLL